jgi:hypothetical protein
MDDEFSLDYHLERGANAAARWAKLRRLSTEAAELLFVLETMDYKLLLTLDSDGDYELFDGGCPHAARWGEDFARWREKLLNPKISVGGWK